MDVCFVVVCNGEVHAVFKTRASAERHCSKVTDASPRIIHRSLEE